MKKTMFALTLLSVLSGCASLDNATRFQDGTQVTQAQIQAFKPGVTTKDQIMASLGAPQSVDQLAGDTHLVYSYTELNNFSANKSQRTVFVIDGNGILKQVLTGGGQARNPLLDAAGGGL